MPKLTKSLSKALNEQIQNEISSAYLYLAMAAECSNRNLKGTANWLRVQWQEELTHATKMLDYVLERGNDVRLRAIPEPVFEFKSLTAVFEHVLEHEQAVSSAISALYGKAAEEQDFAAQAFLQWFVTEQVEEENSAQAVLDMLRIGGDQGTALLLVDRHLAQRGAAGAA
jgi:ferritin